jgi:hypothetical protein
MIKKILFSILLFLVMALLLGFLVKGKPDGNKLYFQNQHDTSSTGPFEASNSTSRYALTESIVDLHSLFFDNALARFASPDVTYYQGHFFTLFTPGVSFLGVPAYWLGKLFGAPQLFTFALTTLVAICNVFLIAFIVYRFTKSFISGLIGGLTFLFATNALTYAFTFTQHHYSVLFILLGILNVMGKRTWWNNLWFGLLFSGSLLLDVPNVFFMLPLLLYILFTDVFQIHLRNGKFQFVFPWRSLWLFIGILYFVGAFLWYNHATTDSYTKLAQFIGRSNVEASIALKGKPTPATTVVTESKGAFPPFGMTSLPYQTRLQMSGLYILLFSDERAWWYYSPVILLGLLGFWILYKKSEFSNISLVLFSILLVDILTYSMFGDPWGGWAFGARYLIPGASMLCIGLGVLISKYMRNIFFVFLFLAGLLYSVWVNVLGALTTSLIPPKVEAVTMQVPIPYTYAYNLQVLQRNISGSLLYNFFFHRYLSVQSYLWIVVCLILTLFICLIGALFWSTRERSHS